MEYLQFKSTTDCCYCIVVFLTNLIYSASKPTAFRAKLNDKTPQRQNGGTNSGQLGHHSMQLNRIFLLLLLPPSSSTQTHASTGHLSCTSPDRQILREPLNVSSPWILCMAHPPASWYELTYCTCPTVNQVQQGIEPSQDWPSRLSEGKCLHFSGTMHFIMLSCSECSGKCKCYKHSQLWEIDMTVCKVYELVGWLNLF